MSIESGMPSSHLILCNPLLLLLARCYYHFHFMDKKTEAQRVWIITWLDQGGMRFNFRAAGMHSQRAFQPMPPSFETLLGPEGSWINPFPSLVLSFLMCKTGGATAGDIRESHQLGWGHKTLPCSAWVQVSLECLPIS